MNDNDGGEVVLFPGQEYVDQSAVHEPNVDVVNFLKNMLERAERGEICGVAIVAAETSGEWVWKDCAGQMNALTTIGALQVLSHRFIAQEEDE